MKLNRPLQEQQRRRHEKRGVAISRDAPLFTDWAFLPHKARDVPRMNYSGTFSRRFSSAAKFPARSNRFVNL